MKTIPELVDLFAKFAGVKTAADTNAIQSAIEEKFFGINPGSGSVNQSAPFPGAIMTGIQAFFNSGKETDFEKFKGTFVIAAEVNVPANGNVKQIANYTKLSATSSNPNLNVLVNRILSSKLRELKAHLNAAVANVETVPPPFSLGRIFTEISVDF